MEITEVRVKLIEETGERLLAFCSITFDDSFVVRDLKIIDGSNGPFVAMPSRKLTARCPRCRCKNYLKAAYCNQCGMKLVDSSSREGQDDTGRTKLYADIAHPINTACREMIQQRIVKAYEEELLRSKQPGYVSSYVDYPDQDDLAPAEPESSAGGPHFDLASTGPTKAAPVEPEKVVSEKTDREKAPDKTAPAEPGPVKFGDGVF